jgi:hypothetical protein
MSIARGKFCGYFPPLEGIGIYWQYPLPNLMYTERKVPSMKIVILRTPALLAPILRRVFGIRKEKKH